MRLRTVVKIDNKEYTVKELTVREIIDLFSTYKFDGSSPNPDTSPEQLLGLPMFTQQIVKIALEGADTKDLIEMAPSELNVLYEAFKEVNKHFFEVAQTMKLGDLLKETIQGISRDFSVHAIGLSRRAIQESGDMDTPSL